MPDDLKLCNLSPREMEVALGIAGGKTVAEMAAEMTLCFETVKFHIRKLRDKTGLRRSVQLAVWASERQAALRGALRKAGK